jgi:hypothetical protein
MGNKDRGGREKKKPKKKPVSSGQTPSPFIRTPAPSVRIPEPPKQ